MVFSNPHYLWGLLGLLIPLAIHLWSNKKGKVIKIGSIRHLKETDATQTNSIQLNELVLLALRMLVIGFIVLLMAQPKMLQSQGPIASITYVIERSLLQDNDIRSTLQNAPDDAVFRLLEQDLPKIDLDDIDIEQGAKDTPPNYWQLLPALEQLKSDSTVIYTQGFQKGLFGKRPTTNAPLNWIVLDQKTVDDSPQLLKTQHGNEIEIRRQSNNLTVTLKEYPDSINTGLSTKEIGSRVNPQSYRIALEHGDSLTEQLEYFELAFRSISKVLNRPLQIEKNLDGQSLREFNPDLYVNLNKSHSIDSMYKTIRLNPGTWSNDLLIEEVKGKQYVLNKLLDPEIIVENHFLEELVELMDLSPEIRHQIDSLDNRTVSAFEIEPAYLGTSDQSNVNTAANMSKWIALFLGVLMISERFIAKSRKQ